MNTQQRIAEIKARMEADRAELERLEAEEKARRPALAEGQVWRIPKYGISIVCEWKGSSGTIYSLAHQTLDSHVSGFHESFEYVGLARDVLRVVEPPVESPPAAPQDEPTGEALVGQRCWVRHDLNQQWQDRVVKVYDASEGSYCYGTHPYGTHPGCPPFATESLVWWSEAKLYREGVAP